MRTSTTDMTSSQRSPKGARPFLLWLTLGMICVLLAVLMQQEPDEPVAEVSLSELENKQGLMVLKSTDTPFTGLVKDFRRDGSLLSCSFMVEGRFHGVSEGYHTNGVLQVSEHYQSGLSHGKRTTWYANGSTQTVAHLSDGMINGDFLRFHENGTLAEKVPMLDGKPHGLAQAWFTNGEIKSSVQLNLGNVVKADYYELSQVVLSDPK